MGRGEAGKIIVSGTGIREDVGTKIGGVRVGVEAGVSVRVRIKSSVGVGLGEFR